MEVPQREAKVHINLDQFNTVFVDGVQVDATADVIYLMLMQNLPGTPEDAQPSAKVVSRVALSWPHAARLAHVINTALEEKREEIRASYTQFVFEPKKE